MGIFHLRYLLLALMSDLAAFTLGQKGGQDFRERHEKVKYVPKNMVFQFLETFGDEIFRWAL